MLPDIPDVKRELGRKMLLYIHRRAQSVDPVLSQIRTFVQHEGAEYHYTPIGGVPQTEGYNVISAAMTVGISEVPSLTGERFMEKINSIADELGHSAAKMFFETLQKSNDESGQVVDGGDKPLHQSMLEMFEKVQVEFDSEGRPTSMFVVHPDMVETLKKAAEVIENDPELKQRNEQILREQLEAFVARENNRTLVD
jgi:hypothetical protein